MTDEELIARARAGDSEALGALLIARQDQIYRTAYLYTHNQADALDVVQETAVQAIQSVRRLRQPEYFTTWLMRIVMNVALKQQRGRARVVPLADPEQGSTGFAEQSGKRLDLADQLALLPPRYRQPLILFYYNDLSIAAIAQALRIPQGTVKSRLHRGIVLLREKGAELDAYRFSADS